MASTRWLRQESFDSNNNFTRIRSPLNSRKMRAIKKGNTMLYNAIVCVNGVMKIGVSGPEITAASIAAKSVGDYSDQMSDPPVGAIWKLSRSPLNTPHRTTSQMTQLKCRHQMCRKSIFAKSSVIIPRYLAITSAIFAKNSGAADIETIQTCFMYALRVPCISLSFETINVESFLVRAGVKLPQLL